MVTQDSKGCEGDKKSLTRFVKVEKGDKLEKLEMGTVYYFPQNIIVSSENHQNNKKMVEVKDGQKIKNFERNTIYCFPQNIILTEDESFNRYLRDWLTVLISQRDRK